MQTLRAYLELTRPANVVTALADAGAGAAVAFAVVDPAREGMLLSSVPWVLLASAGLYAGGVVFNDFFDVPVDRHERPERPIPSGRASRLGAGILGSILLLVALGAAFWVGWFPGVLAVGIAAAALFYDSTVKDHLFAGPLTMGVCRGGNLLLGVSIVPAAVGSFWYLGLFPVVYIAAITAISQGEVHGGSRQRGWMAVGLLAVVGAALPLLSLDSRFRLLVSLPFLVLFLTQVGPPFIKAARTPVPDRIGAAVQAGVLAVITFDAVLAAGFGGWIFGGGVLLLLPVSRGLARLFVVT